MAKKLTVVISQSQGKNPAKRQLEEDLATALIMESDVDVSLIPHMYDMTRDHTGMLFLRSIPGDVIVLSWLYPRSSHWILDRNGVRGKIGVTLLKNEEDKDDDTKPKEEPKSNGIGSVEIPNRTIYCIDLRSDPNKDAYVNEIERIIQENSVKTYDLMQWIQGSPRPEQIERYLKPEQQIAASKADRESKLVAGANGNGDTAGNEAVKRRWYPVIDYDRCTNCMECIDFCLFGVYGLDQQDRILVELQDNCKKGCPACSRVCPENAIVFPGHKSPAIAGADGEVGSLKIDLSKLFGGPGGIDLASRERDVELVLDGRDAVGLSTGIPKRHLKKNKKRDELDDLIDSLDKLEL